MVTQAVTGFVYQDGDAYATYFARWTSGRKEHGANFLVQTGEWGEDPSENRLAVAMEMRILEDGPGFMVIDAQSSPWGEKDLLARKLTREEVMSSPIRQEAFDLIDYIIVADDDVRQFIYGQDKLLRRLSRLLSGLRR